MYAEFFGLRELPFNNTPDPRFFYSTPDHEEALASLVYAVKEKKGFVLLTGEIGAGKTLVSRLMIKHFGATIAFANINHAIRDSGDLIESMCAEFELPCNKEDSGSHRVRILHDFLLARFAQNVPVVLVLDEAQNLSVDAFEQLRMIGNLEADDAKLLQIVIVGQPELQTLFQSAGMRQLRQRLFRSFHLPALNCAHVDGYIRFRLSVAGAADPGLFGEDGAAAIHRASSGLPRLINTLCDNILLSAYSAGRNQLDLPFIESVLATFADATPQSSAWPVPATELSGPRIAPGAPPLRPQHPDKLVRAGESAVRMIAKLDTSIQRGSDVACRLTAAAERAEKSGQALEQREQQLKSLVRLVQSSASRLAPMLAELYAVSRMGAKVIAEARDAAKEKPQGLRTRRDDKIQQVREAAFENSWPLRSQSLHREAARPYAPMPPAPPRDSGVSRPYRPAVIRQSTAEKAAVIPAELEDSVASVPHPALRLAHRMESLAAMVQNAVAECTPDAK